MKWNESRIDYIEAQRKYNEMMTGRKENKMTREEAIKKYMEATAWPEASSKMYIEGLEALGLIKFEEKKKVDVIDILKAHTSDWYSLIQELNENGWYIKK